MKRAVVVFVFVMFLYWLTGNSFFERSADLAFFVGVAFVLAWIAYSSKVVLLLLIPLSLQAGDELNIKTLTRREMHEIDRQVSEVRLVSTERVKIGKSIYTLETYKTKYTIIKYYFNYRNRVYLQIVTDTAHIMTKELINNLLSVIIHKPWRYIGNNRYVCDGITAYYVDDSIYASTGLFRPPKSKEIDINMNMRQ